MSSVYGVVHNAWGQQDIRPVYPKLNSDLEVDVAIVGGGIAGLCIAYNLVTQGKTVAVLESRALGAGQTGRTTAHLMLWNDDYYYLIEKEHSSETARLVADSHRKSIDWVAKVVADEHINCNFEWLDGYLFPADDSPKHLETLEKERVAAVKAGLVDTEWVDLQGDPASGNIKRCLRFPRSAEFHPLMFLDGLAKAITRHGGAIYEQTHVKKHSGTELTVGDGHTVKAGNVVLATNSPINKNLAVHARQSPYRSYVIGLYITKVDFHEGSYWDTASPYHYVRKEDMGDHWVLIVGGEDHPTGQKPKDYQDNFAKLEKWTRERWTTAGEVIYKWSGQVMEPADMLGMYGKDPLNPNGHVYIATGDSGQGMTGGAIAGITISSQILGKPHAWSSIYSPSRRPRFGLISLEGYMEEIMHTAKGYAEVILPDAPTDIEDVAPGCGGVYRRGLHKVAAYRSETDGHQLHLFSAICPHQGCCVQWNPNDRTFDCPCHGSFFDRFGRVVQAPAKQGLKPLEGK